MVAGETVQAGVPQTVGRKEFEKNKKRSWQIKEGRAILTELSGTGVQKGGRAEKVWKKSKKGLTNRTACGKMAKLLNSETSMSSERVKEVWKKSGKALDKRMEIC